MATWEEIVNDPRYQNADAKTRRRYEDNFHREFPNEPIIKPKNPIVKLVETLLGADDGLNQFKSEVPQMVDGKMIGAERTPIGLQTAVSPVDFVGGGLAAKGISSLANVVSKPIIQKIGIGGIEGLVSQLPGSVSDVALGNIKPQQAAIDMLGAGLLGAGGGLISGAGKNIAGKLTRNIEKSKVQKEISLKPEIEKLADIVKEPKSIDINVDKQAIKNELQTIDKHIVASKTTGQNDIVPILEEMKANKTTQLKEIDVKSLDKEHPSVAGVIDRGQWRDVTSPELKTQTKAKIDEIANVLTHDEAKAMYKADISKNPEKYVKMAVDEDALLKTRNQLEHIKEVQKPIVDKLALGEPITANERALLNELEPAGRIISKNAAQLLEAHKGKYNLADIDNMIEGGGALRDAAIKTFKQAGKDIENFKIEAEKVDWNDIDSVTEFTRKYVKPTFDDIDKGLTYGSMMSSFKTLLTNVFGNQINAGIVHPIRLALTGAIDWMASGANKLVGKYRPRKHLIGEAAKFAEEYYSGLLAKDTWKSVGDAFKGKYVGGGMTQPELIHIPPFTKKQPIRKFAYDALTIMSRAAKATDILFAEPAKKGAQQTVKYAKGKGVSFSDLVEEVANRGRGAILNQEFGTDKELTSIVVDTFGKFLQKLTNLHGENKATEIALTPVRIIARSTIPFVRFIINNFKQGINALPHIAALNLATAFKTGASKSKIIADAIMGTSIMGVMGMLASSGRIKTNFASDKNPEMRTMAAAAGIPPYSFKLANSDVNIQYNNLPGAISFPMLTVGWVTDALRNKEITQSKADAILSTLPKYLMSLIASTPLKSVNNALDAITGSNPNAVNQLATGYAQQRIPLGSMLAEFQRAFDDFKRRPDNDASVLEKSLDTIFGRIPGLAGQVPPMRTKTGDYALRSDIEKTSQFLPLVNLVKENPEAKENYTKAMEMRRVDGFKNQIIKAAENGNLPKIERLVDSLNESKKDFEYIDMDRYSSQLGRLYDIVKKRQEMINSGKPELIVNRAFNGIINAINNVPMKKMQVEKRFDIQREQLGKKETPEEYSQRIKGLQLYKKRIKP